MTIQELAKQSSGISCQYTITPEIYYSFQRVSNDFNPLHTDKYFAESVGFPDRVMYGNILNAFVSHFVGMLLPTRSVIIQTQEIDFHKPVFMNDLITLDSSIDTISEAANAIIYKLKFYRENMGGGKKQLVAKGHVQIGILNDKQV